MVGVRIKVGSILIKVGRERGREVRKGGGGRRG